MSADNPVTRRANFKVVAGEETPAARSARLYAEARDAARQTVEEALQALSAAEAKLNDLSTLEAAPAGARDLARRMSEQITKEAATLGQIAGRAP